MITPFDTENTSLLGTLSTKYILNRLNIPSSVLDPSVNYDRLI